MDKQRILWQSVKRALLMVVAAIDTCYGKEQQQ